MNLIIQTPAIPRSELHKACVHTMLKQLNENKNFLSIYWLVNLDVISDNSAVYSWENYEKTTTSFEDLAKNLGKVKLDLKISKTPCFYQAFRSLTLRTLDLVEKNNYSDDDYVVLWLEDDWIFTNIEEFNINLNKFLSSKTFDVMTLNENKINMGGNPDMIKGNVFRLFSTVDLSENNKRDPENIRKHELWYKHIFHDSWNEPLESKPYSRLLKKLLEINGNIKHFARQDNKRIMTSHVVNGDLGDDWRRQKNIQKNWSQSDKHGISAERNYSYK
jgi:hypothetical protein